MVYECCALIACIWTSIVTMNMSLCVVQGWLMCMIAGLVVWLTLIVVELMTQTMMDYEANKSGIDFSDSDMSDVF